MSDIDLAKLGKVISIGGVLEIEVKRILSSIEHLHSSMGILSKLYQMLSSDVADLEAAERLILSDTNLTGAVIRLSNSAAYGRVVKSTDLHSSVVMVGFRQIL